MVTHSKQIRLVGSSHWQRICQRVPAMGGGGRGKSKASLLVTMFEAVWRYRKKHPNPADDTQQRIEAHDNYGRHPSSYRYGGDLRQISRLTDSNHYFFQLSEVISQSTQTAVSCTMSCFHDAKGLQPIPPQPVSLTLSPRRLQLGLKRKPKPLNMTHSLGLWGCL